MRYANRWEMPGVIFYQVEDHGFEAHGDRPLYAYGKPGATNDDGVPKTGELFASLDRAMVAWVAEKYTGPRGAGGTGVGTAADWFIRMIGADTLVAVNHSSGQKVMAEVMGVAAKTAGGFNVVLSELEARGVVLAVMNHGR